MDLITASKHGNLHLVRIMLQRGSFNSPSPRLLRQDSQRRSPPPQLQDEELEDLEDLSNGNSNKILYEALIAASQFGYMSVVQCLVEQGNATLFHKDDNNTPLHVACAMGRTDVAEYLAEAVSMSTASTNETDTPVSQGSTRQSSMALLHLDREGNPPHIVACSNDNTDIAKHLIKTYSDVINVNKGYGREKYTPLHWAARVNNSDMALFLLKDCSSQVNGTSKSGHTPLHLACRRTLINRSAPRSTSLPVLDVLMQNGANLYAVDDTGNTPLLEAVRWNRTDIVARLLEYVQYFSSTNGKNQTYIDRINSQGKCALSIACANKNLEIVQLLLLHGANVFNQQGWQSLTAACAANHANIVRLLVEARFGQQQSDSLLGRRGSLTKSSIKRKRGKSDLMGSSKKQS